MQKQITINRNDKKVINLLKKKGELEFSDFQKIFQLSSYGTRNKIVEYLKKDWIRVKDREAVVFSYVANNGINLEE